MTRERYFSLGRFGVSLILERQPFAFGVMLYGIRRHGTPPQAWLYLS